MILIIDDDIAVRTSLLLILQQEGYKASGAGTPEEALEIIKRSKPSLVLLDLNFSLGTSGKEGMALLKEIKQYDTGCAGNEARRE
jgi:DNA-binding NtrC family response regulator